MKKGEIEAAILVFSCALEPSRRISKIQEETRQGSLGKIPKDFSFAKN